MQQFQKFFVFLLNQTKFNNNVTTYRYVEDKAEFILLALQHVPQIVARTVDHMVMTWLLTLVGSAHCFNNPYLVAKLVEVLFMMMMMNPSVQVLSCLV